MTTPTQSPPPIIDSVLFPADFTEPGGVAFAHALKAALVARTRLTLLHVAPKGADAEWADFPGVRQMLERWKLIPPHSQKAAVPELGIDVVKVVRHGDDPARAVLHFLDAHLTDLIVLAPHRHDDRVGWFHKSISGPIARKSGQMSLFVPDGVAGFVSPADGTASLTNVLIPVADTPKPQPALTAAARVVRGLNCPAGTFTLLHVGSGNPAVDLFRPDVPGWTWNSVTKAGDVIDTILQTADETHAGLIAMSTAGHHGFLDALRGSTSERVLRRAACPLLVVPEHSHAGEAMRM
jgi:nucleotide-binding universal stress UspA family protein